MAQDLTQLSDHDLRGLAAWQGVPSSGSLELAPEPVGTEAVPTKARRVRAVAYSGAPVDRTFGTMIINLATLRIPESGKVPMMFRHGRSGMCDEIEDPNLGVWDKIENDGKRLAVEGFLLQSPLADRVVSYAKQGFPWQNSVGVSSGKLRQIPEGQTEVINGRECGEGMYVYEDALLREDSILELGADHSTPTEVELQGPKAQHAATFARRGKERLQRLMNTLGIPLSALREELDLDTNGTIAGVKTPATGDLAMATDTKPAPAPATLQQLKALKGASGDFIVKAMEQNLTIDAAAVALCDDMATQLANLRTQHASELEKLKADHATALAAETEKAAKLQERIDASIKLGAIDPLKLTKTAAEKNDAGAGDDAKHFAGAKGENFEDDWDNCEALRTQFNNDKTSFRRFAKSQTAAGQSWLIKL